MSLPSLCLPSALDRVLHLAKPSPGVFEALPSVLDTLAKLPIPVVNVLQQHFLCVGSPVPWMLIGSCSSMRSFSLVGLKAKQP